MFSWLDNGNHLFTTVMPALLAFARVHLPPPLPPLWHALGAYQVSLQGLESGGYELSSKYCHEGAEKERFYSVPLQQRQQQPVFPKHLLCIGYLRAFLKVTIIISPILHMQMMKPREVKFHI